MSEASQECHAELIDGIWEYDNCGCDDCLDRQHEAEEG